MLADIVVGLQHGDEAKGKVTHHLCRNGDYTHVLRFNGGGNAGHTIYHEGKKFVTHYIPAGVFYGIKSIIGSGCVLNPKHFFEEIEELKLAGIDTSLVKIAKNCHIITDEHLKEDKDDKKIGTTKRGTGPAYRNKYNRSGHHAESVSALAPYLIDMYEEFHASPDVKVLCEGAQGFGLDVDWGDYPYVTSSHCTSAGALLNGIPPNAVRHIWGVGKMYDTYVGNKRFQPDEEIFNELRELGEEYGATTGRPRQCDWLDLTALYKSIQINGVTHVVLNKADVLDDLGTWQLKHNKELKVFSCQKDMCDYIITNIQNTAGNDPLAIVFSGDKHSIDSYAA
jgi:adenylosuccinate synthase|tara:strand:- start:2500 stop:3513 length:1014 start_codon:yes stop_codon:yes gene_type:complete